MSLSVYRTDSIPVSAKKTADESARDPACAPATPEIILQHMAALQLASRKIGGLFRSAKNSHVGELNVNSEGSEGSLNDQRALTAGGFFFSRAPDPLLRSVPVN